MQIEFEFDVASLKGLYDFVSPLRFSRAVNKAARQLAAEAIDQFGKTVEGWRTPVEFFVDFNLDPSGGSVSFAIWTNSDIYRMVDEGTPPHTIRMRGKWPLTFSQGFVAATQPNVIGSQEAIYSDEFWYASEIQHPGAEARNFSEIIAQQIFDEATDAVLAQLDLAAQRQLGA
jgi:hypothetical protein